MASSSFPALAGVLCAAVLALEGTLLVVWARDQHAARRRVLRAVVLCVFALVLTLAGAVAGGHTSVAHGTALTGGDGVPIAPAILFGAWALAALTLIEVRSGVLLVAGGPFPLNLRPIMANGMAEERRWPVMHARSDGVIPRVACLAVLAVAVAVAVAVGARASGVSQQVGRVPATAGAARVAAVVVVAIDAVVAALACAQRGSHPRRAGSLLAFGIALSTIALASLVVGP